MEDSEDKTAAASHDLLNYVKRLEGRLNAVEEGRSQASAPSTSPGSQRGSHTSENASVFRETLKNYGPFGQRMTVNDLSGEDGIERGVDIRAGAARAQQEYPRQAQGQGMVRDMPPQRHPVMNPFGPSGGVTIPKLNIQNFNGAEIYAGLGAGFKQWAYLFIEAIEVTELSSGFAWTERLKVNKLGEHMEVHAASYFQANIGICCAQKKPIDVNKKFSNMVMNVATEGVQSDVQKGTLHHFHARLGHLAYDTIEKLAKDSRSGIAITDHSRPNCLTCAEGKSTRAKQAQKDTGQHAPI
ncbi:unnamed protein product [Peronospora farinosa]|uniref:GAG-pre-integrase domain-containing protein n=1 Tax=Peronospora farinosa TaxID=134698 RepID=A0AAV0TGQ1_9STRA|nr:unnamed protein product [Peronospora farinosa]